MAIAQDVVTLALQNILNDDAQYTPQTVDLNLGLTLLINLLDHMQLDPQTAIGLQEFVYTPTAGTQSITIGPSKSVTLTSSGTTATATSTNHGLESGLRVTISGAAQTEYNGVYTITVTGANTFTYQFAGSITSPATGTILASPDIVTIMPPRLEESSFCRLGGVDFLIGFAPSMEVYNQQPVKTNQGYPQKCFYMPDADSLWGTLYMWPASNGAELHIWIREQPLQGFTTMGLSTTLTLPMGLQKVLIDCLAAEMVDAWNIPQPAYEQIKRKAQLSLRKWKRANLKLNELSMPNNLGRFTANNYTA